MRIRQLYNSEEQAGQYPYVGTRYCGVEETRTARGTPVSNLDIQYFAQVYQWPVVTKIVERIKQPLRRNHRTCLV